MIPVRQCRAVLGVLVLPLAIACGTVHIRDSQRGGAAEPQKVAAETKQADEPTRPAVKDTRRKGERGVTILFEDGRAHMRAESAVCRLRSFRMASGLAFADPLRDALARNGYTITDRRSDGFDLEVRLRGVMRECNRRGAVDGDIALEVVRDGVLVEEIVKPIANKTEEELTTALVAEATTSKRIADALKGRVVAITPVQAAPVTTSAVAVSETRVSNAPLVMDNPTSILVMPLKPIRGVDKGTCQLLSNYMLSQMQGVKKLRTVGASDVDAALGVDKQKQALGCSDVSCMAEMGGALGVDLVMYGELGVLGTKYNVNVSAVRASDATVAARASILVDKTEDALAEKVPALVRDVVDGINSSAANAK